MVTLQEFIAFLEKIAPPALAEDYDNVGLLIKGNKEKINRVLVTLDTDELVAEEAEKTGVDLILSHHPLIFRPLKRFTDNDPTARCAASVIRKNISLYAFHTNFDNACLCDIFLDKIAETKNRRPLTQNGIGRIAELTSPVTLSDLLTHLAEEFGLDDLRYVGSPDDEIYTIAVCNGGGGELITDAFDAGADCYISGDFKYHQARFSYENGIPMIEIPHYHAEKCFMQYMQNQLEKHFGDELTVFVSGTNTDIYRTFYYNG